MTPAWVKDEPNPRPFRTTTLKLTMGGKTYIVFAGYIEPHVLAGDDHEMVYDMAYSAMEREIFPNGPFVADIIELWHGDKVVRQGKKPHVPAKEKAA